MIWVYTLVACVIMLLTFKLNWQVANNKLVNMLIKFMFVCLLVLGSYILFVLLSFLFKLLASLILFLMKVLI